MLANVFKTAAQLGIGENDYKALVTVLYMLEEGKLQHVDIFQLDRAAKLDNGFNMATWGPKAGCNCNTVGCIGLWAERFGATLLGLRNSALDDLFVPQGINGPLLPYSSITTVEAAQALRNYLTLGHACWEKVLQRGKGKYDRQLSME